MCNCTSFSSFYLKNESNCETYDQIECLKNTTAIAYNNNFITSECTPLCPIECNRTVFKPSGISSYVLTGELFYDYIQDHPNLLVDFVNRPITIENALDSFTALNVYYRYNYYTLSTQSPSMDMVSLLANLGGTLGLFIGISLIQLCEIIDVLIQIILIKTKIQNIKVEPSLND
jgi:hypothetical protein